MRRKRRSKTTSYWTEVLLIGTHDELISLSCIATSDLTLLWRMLVEHFTSTARVVGNCCQYRTHQKENNSWMLYDQLLCQACSATQRTRTPTKSHDVDGFQRPLDSGKGHRGYEKQQPALDSFCSMSRLIFFVWRLTSPLIKYWSLVLQLREQNSRTKYKSKGMTSVK